MLQELSIENFAIIEKLTTSFESGMTVLTGETGAGKSIIIDAVGLLTGGRGSVDFIRQGTPKCWLEGQFEVNQTPELSELLESLAIENPDNVLIVSREITTAGKNTCRVNGRLVNTTQLREIGRFLVDIQGQNEHQALLQSDQHLGMLDQFGGKELLIIKTKYQELFASYQTLLRQVRNKQANEKEFAQRMDMLTFQSAEIAEADLKVGEEDSLIEERQRLNNFHQIVSALNTTYSALSDGEPSALDSIGSAMSEMSEIENLDSEYSELSETVKSSYYQLQEAANQASRLVDSLEVDEDRINQVESRLDVIRQMKRKYGESEEAILAYWESIDLELKEGAQANLSGEELTQALAEKEAELRLVAEELSVIRRQVATRLESEILEELAGLYLEKALFEVRFTEVADFTVDGLETVEFYLTTNPGEPLKPLVKVASGGELSRILLALKAIFVKTQHITSIVFDEVDTGVSGRVAQGIANKIYQVSAGSQVLCISHLPQVAAMADCHLYISKEVVAGRTKTGLTQLSKEERVMEIARMLAGEEITELTKEHAKELLSLAHK
ncbi:DNA repair protein RecN [Vagococcus coleopterorum]|uniref:DNA repair protein RecN n=1 Tax=Vagococcus coleopterorum TaxID=2714946 RepID=A0A6G8AKU9_9ENTE|nr:DNA repair protein RecN [Vagococcus coleopterorum]QIL45589.1 DNA repair protein RecN [Vagococcus coleopterorum]